MSIIRPVNFGFNQITAINRANGKPYGDAKVLGSVEINRTVELVETRGGSIKDPVAINTGSATSEGTLTLREMPSWLWEVFNGSAATANVAESGGAITQAITNYLGTSIVSATTGIASVTIKTGSEAFVPSGKYVVIAASATTVNVYPYSDVDFSTNDIAYADSSLAINSTPFTITASAATEIVDDNAKSLGLELTGGSGVIAMTIGDSAIFEVRGINVGSYEVTVGGNNEQFKEFGLVLTSEKDTKGAFQIMEIFRVVAGGMPVGYNENAPQEISVSFKPVADACNNNAVYKITQEYPSDNCIA